MNLRKRTECTCINCGKVFYPSRNKNANSGRSVYYGRAMAD